MKKERSKYTGMIVLMISSQLLLMGFVSYWLVSQYKHERSQLQTLLTHELYSAYDHLVDSMLMEHLITPTLNDSLMVKVNLTEMGALHAGSKSDHASVIIKHIEADSSMEPDSLLMDSIRFLSTAGEERLVRSVKLFINETDAAFRTDAKAHVFSMNMDSVILLQMLNETFLAKDWKFNVSWMGEDPEAAMASSQHGILIQSKPHLEMSNLHVEHIAPYLLGLMLPQFIFGLILLGLSASALIIAYRSLKKQLVLNELRNDFISNISHELKTPVSTVKVALEALRTFDLKEDPKASKSYLEMASKEAERLENLVGKVLNHQLLEDPSAVIQKESCDMGELVGNVLRTLELPIKKAGAKVDLELPQIPCLVLADPVYLESVVINLIDNSLKYAGPNPEILVEIVCSDKEHLLMVSDHGPGIPEAYRDQIYEKFFRIPSGDHHNVKGYGLGLNFASRVMAHHGGAISFRNLPERGCKFTLSFPK
jgi:signal transduction histidine kinase